MFKNRDYSARNIRRIIKGTAWNTKTAELIYETKGHSDPIDDFGESYYGGAHRLYRTRRGNKFFVVRFDHLTFINEEIGHEFVDTLEPISYEEAKELIEKYATDEVYEHCFEVTEAGDGEVVISLRTTERLSKAIKIMAKIKKQSSNTFLNNLITETARANITEIKAYAEQVKMRKIAAEKLRNANNEGE